MKKCRKKLSVTAPVIGPIHLIERNIIKIPTISASDYISNLIDEQVSSFAISFHTSPRRADTTAQEFVRRVEETNDMCRGLLADVIVLHREAGTHESTLNRLLTWSKLRKR